MTFSIFRSISSTRLLLARIIYSSFVISTANSSCTDNTGTGILIFLKYSTFKFFCALPLAQEYICSCLPSKTLPTKVLLDYS